MQVKQYLTSSIFRTFFASIFLVCTSFVSVEAQRIELTKPLKFDRLEQVKELGTQTVNSIVQDDAGFMWFGSINGLIRFDGYKIKMFRHDPNNSKSLANNSIQAIAKDKHGNLWIATEGAGLERFDLKTETFYHHQHDPNDPSSLSGNSLVSVFVDREGMIWTGTFSNGLNRLDPLTGKFIAITEDRYLPIRSITQDDAGNIWFSSNGINKLNTKALTIDRFPAGADDPTSVATGGIRSILIAKNNTIWIGTHDEDGLMRFSKNGKRFSAIPLYDGQNTSVYSLHEDSLRQLWIGTSRGVAVLTDNTVQYYQPDACDPHTIAKKIVLNVYEDDDKNIWFACESGGVNKTMPAQKFQRYFYPNSKAFQNHNAIRSLCEDYTGKIWIGWVEGGIEIINPTTQAVQSFSINGKDDINCIYQDKDSSFLIGTWDAGLFHYSKTGKLIRQYKHQQQENSIPDNRVQTIYRDRFGVLWIATENGLSQLDIGKNNWVHFKKPEFPEEMLGNNVQSLALAEEPDGTLWMGTWSGLNRISPDRKSVKHFVSTDPYYAINDHFISLYMDSVNRVLWIGTYEGGLRKLDLKTETFSYYTEEQGLPNNTVFTIIPDNENHLWLSTNNGISKFSPQRNTFYNYDVTDGLQGNEFFWGVGLKLRSGEILMGGISGLNLFDPTSIHENEKVPRVVFTEFEIFNKPVNIGEKSLLQSVINDTEQLIIPYNQSVITFGFSAINYVYPEKNQYAYLLEEFDADWNYVADGRSATYTNLEPGEYTFRVKASNNDGVWNETGKSIKLIITPPFWLTWWFKLLTVLVVAGSLFSFYRIRISVEKKQRRSLEQQVFERTEEIVKKNREIMEQMRQVENLNDEIALQRDNIEYQNNLLESAKTQLEQKVNERTLELSQTNQELMEQNVQLEQFAFMTAHNLRAPVARLLGLTSIFNSRDRSDPLNGDIIKRIQTSASGLDEVIRDIADILQVKKGIHRNIETIEVLPAITKALQTLRHEIEASHIEVSNQVPSGILIKGITPYVHSVFYNIISNAVKYADLRKKPMIDIQVSTINDFVVITFSDNGIGFDSDSQKEKLFKPFSRLNFTGDGKGLGLFLVKIQMETIGGDIEVVSEVDEGTKVVLYFKTA